MEKRGIARGKRFSICSHYSLATWTVAKGPERVWREIRGKLLQDFIISATPGMSSHSLATWTWGGRGDSCGKTCWAGWRPMQLKQFGGWWWSLPSACATPLFQCETQTCPDNQCQQNVPGQGHSRESERWDNRSINWARWVCNERIQFLPCVRGVFLLKLSLD